MLKYSKCYEKRVTKTPNQVKISKTSTGKPKTTLNKQVEGRDTRKCSNPLLKQKSRTLLENTTEPNTK